MHVRFIFLLFPFLWCMGQNSESITVRGQVFAALSGSPLPAVEIVVLDANNDAPLGSTETDGNGNFVLTVSSKKIYFEARLAGYTTQIISFFSEKDGGIVLEPIYLSTQSTNLDEVVVRAEKSQTVFNLDKRVFNVGEDISSTGMSALEVLNNVPSVNVDIEGQVSLRGSGGVQILINGKPSVLADESSNALGTITADMIESIEVITNPSAKYEASGTSGILNIILRKEEKKGWNGSISANTGTPANHSLGVSINRRTEKFNLFSQMGVGYRSLPRENESENRNLVSDEIVRSTGIDFRNEQFFNITLGTDYHINDRNVLTLSGNFAYEIEDQPSETRFVFLEGDQLVSRWLREETTDATNPKWQYELNYKREFANNKEHTFQLSALGSFFGKDQASQFLNTTLEGSDINGNQETETVFQQAEYTFQADYVNPLSEIYTLETGAQYVINDTGNDFEVRDEINGQFVVNESLTNDFDYNQKVFGVYATFAYEQEKFGVKAGLRIENTDLSTLLVNTNEANDQNFTNFFPTFHSSYEISKNLAFQLGYSRRIFRPRLWDLNPFFNIRNNFNIRAGNPNLLPEFTDSYELTSIYKIGKASFSSSLYHRYTTEVVERVSTFDNNVTFSSPQNIGTNSSIGFETNGKYSPTKWLTLTGDFNVNYFERKGDFEGVSLDFSGRQWSGRLGTKWDLPADVDLELTGNYQSGFNTLQGDVSGFAFLDLGLRKKIFKGKLVANFAVRDVFESRIFERFVRQPTFESDDFGLRGRFITFGLSFGFGKGEAITYSGRRR